MTEESRVEFGVEKASGLYPNANLRVSFDCFWPLGCSDSKRCNEHGSCVAAAQSGGRTFDQGTRPSMTAEASKVNKTKEPMSRTTVPAPPGVKLQCHHEGCQHEPLSQANALLRDRIRRDRARVSAIRQVLQQVEALLKEFES